MSAFCLATSRNSYYVLLKQICPSCKLLLKNVHFNAKVRTFNREGSILNLTRLLCSKSHNPKVSDIYIIVSMETVTVLFVVLLLLWFFILFIKMQQTCRTIKLRMHIHYKTYIKLKTCKNILFLLLGIVRYNVFNYYRF